MLYPREILAKIRPFLRQQVIVLLVGSRQVGKTYLLRLIDRELRELKIADDRQIIHFDLESFDDLRVLENSTYKQFAEYLYAQTSMKTEKELYVFIDEIQYLKRNASSFFKLLADHYPKIHLFLSGSSSLEIKKIFTDRLTGRKVLFHVRPLDFSEYLVFQEHELVYLIQNINRASLLQGDVRQLESAKNFISKLLPSYEDFVVFGSYPRPSLKSSRPVREKFLQEIRDTYVRKDISDILRVENISGFNRLLQLLAAQTGNLINVQELSTASALSRDSVEKYLFLMQETYILSLVTPWFRNARQELIKMPKVYIDDTGIRNTLLNNTQPLDERVDKGALLENAVFNQLQYLEYPIKFWRTKAKAEVDFVLTLQNNFVIPMEVKCQPFKKPTVPTALASFIKHYQPTHAFVVTKDFLSEKRLGKTIIYFVPALFF